MDASDSLTSDATANANTPSLWDRQSTPGTPLRTTRGEAAIQWRAFGPTDSTLPPLVLLHGGHGSGLHWVRNAAVLAAHRRVFVPDMPSYGDSADLPGAPHLPERLQRLAEAVSAGLDELTGAGVPIDVAAFSFGTLVAAELTRLRPIRRLALVGAAGHRTPRRQAVPLQDWRLPDAAAKTAALRQNLEVFMFAPGAPIDELSLGVHTWSCERTRFRSKSLSIGADIVGTLQHYEQPVLLLWGEHDVTATPELAAPRVADGRPQRPWVLLPGAGHWLQYELADEVNRRLLAWFADAV